ncbi:Sulfate transporter [Seminavis robusta]|uniref:Sulfate transporter n=1 Tax=Seminavis robusta TaxID=568900 RepID=A0A9N8EU34_9STRA|nr:Sulfate transporter [Seminavis robusta]|eukprot:Sro1692_g291590.1 Sulfate transporter (180) ;mRNA; f:23300-24104
MDATVLPIEEGTDNNKKQTNTKEQQGLVALPSSYQKEKIQEDEALLSFSEHSKKQQKRTICGSVGDLGTFIPLAVALARQNAIALAPTLFWAGFANVMTGCAWDVPMGVQPMKAIAATAIAHELTNRIQVTIAGIFMGLFMIALSITKGIELVNWLVQRQWSVVSKWELESTLPFEVSS